MTFNPFNELNGPKTIGGVWSVNDPSLPLPVTYDSDVTVPRTVPDGSYTYTYTVTCSGVTVSNDLTLNLGATKARRNDFCTGASSLISLNDTVVLNTTGNGLGQCPVGPATTDLVTSLHNNFGDIADLWYSFELQPNTADRIIEVDIQPTGTDPAGGLNVSLYENQEFRVCVSNSTAINNPKTFGQGTIYWEFQPSTETRYFLVRVGMDVLGEFALTVRLVPAIP